MNDAVTEHRVTIANDAGHNQSVDVSYFAQTPDGQRRNRRARCPHECTKQTLAGLRPRGTGGPGRGYERCRIARPEHLNPWRAGRAGGFRPYSQGRQASRLAGCAIDHFELVINVPTARALGSVSQHNCITAESIAAFRVV
jgi:hypothetical protein